MEQITEKERLRRYRIGITTKLHWQNPDYRAKVLLNLTNQHKLNKLKDKEYFIDMARKSIAKQVLNGQQTLRNRRIAQKGYQGLLKARGIKFDDDLFISKQELECYKFLKDLGLSKKEINHDFKIGRFRIDFFPKGKFFWEHHPIPKIRVGRYSTYQTKEEYFKARRTLLNKNGYSNQLLIVTEKLKDKGIIERMLTL